MAKQKSGLGRGLNALFEENPISPVPDTLERNKEPKREEATPQPKKEAAAPEQQKGSQKKAQQEKQDTATVDSGIYFSEDALENAKVVSREARKPTKRSAKNGAGATAQMFEREKQHTQSVPKTVDKQEDKPKKQAVTEQKATKGKGDTGVVPLDQVKPNPDQPRTNFKKEEIDELAGSIKKEGLLQPILVRKTGDHYQIIAGERRWQACKQLDMKEIPVRFWEADSDKALELALIENIQRTDLNPIEEAYGYKRLMERKGMTQSEVAQTVSKGRSTIANALRLLDLPEDAQQLLFEDKITAGHARAILSIPDTEGRKTLTKKLIDEKLSVRETEQIARLLSGRAQAAQSGATKRTPASASFKKAARGLARYLSVPVKVKTAQGKNKIEIQFKDEEELQRIIKLISAVETQKEQ